MALGAGQKFSVFKNFGLEGRAKKRPGKKRPGIQGPIRYYGITPMRGGGPKKNNNNKTQPNPGNSAGDIGFLLKMA